MLVSDVGAETLTVTTLGRLARGDARQSGAVAQGRRRTRRPYGERPCRRGRRDPRRGAISTAWRISVVRAPHELAKFIAVKGSVALDGTSLTVNAVEGDAFEVLLIPHTLAVTTWGERKTGDRVNIEVDQMARYAARLMEAGPRLMARFGFVRRAQERRPKYG